MKKKRKKQTKKEKKKNKKRKYAYVDVYVKCSYIYHVITSPQVGRPLTHSPAGTVGRQTHPACMKMYVT